MGYFIAKNRSTFSQNTRRGVKLFILGFLLNIGLNFHLYLKIAFAGWQHDPLKYIFGIDILYLAGMSIIVLAVLKLLKKRQEIAAIILFLVVAASTGFMNEKFTVINHYYVLPFIAGNYSWSYFPLFPWIAYPLAGFIYAQYEDRIKRFLEWQKAVSVILLLAVCALVIVFSKQGINTTIDLPAYYHHTFGYILWALGLTFLWVLFLRLFLKLFPNTYVGNFFCWIGKNITLFYVIQWLIIGNIATEVFQTQAIDFYIFWFVSIFSATVLITFYIEKGRSMYKNFIISRNNILRS